MTLLMRTFAITPGLWQALTPCEPCDPAQPDPVDDAPPGFYQELKEALTEYGRGAVPQR